MILDTGAQIFVMQRGVLDKNYAPNSQTIASFLDNIEKIGYSNAQKAQSVYMKFEIYEAIVQSLSAKNIVGAAGAVTGAQAGASATVAPSTITKTFVLRNSVVYLDNKPIASLVNIDQITDTELKVVYSAKNARYLILTPSAVATRVGYIDSSGKIIFETQDITSEMQILAQSKFNINSMTFTPVQVPK
jgi:hypothetical protein